MAQTNKNMQQIPIGTKVKVVNTRTETFDSKEGVIVAAERIIRNKPHRIIHTVLFNGEDQYDYKKGNEPQIACFTAKNLKTI